MVFELWPAMLAGIAGGLVMEAARWLPAAFGRGLTLEFLHTWGTLVGATRTALRPIGLVVHVLGSAAVALLYAAAFDLLGAADALWAWGLAAAAVHLSLAGFVVARIPATRADRPAARLEPGLFASRLGERDTAAFILTHLVYGLAVGVTYALAHSGGRADLAF